VTVPGTGAVTADLDSGLSPFRCSAAARRRARGRGLRVVRDPAARRRRTLRPDEEAEGAISSEAFGALTAELRRAEANHHDIEALLPRFVQVRGFTDADDIAAVLHHRVAAAAVRPAAGAVGHARHRA